MCRDESHTGCDMYNKLELKHVCMLQLSASLRPLKYVDVDFLLEAFMTSGCLSEEEALCVKPAEVINGVLKRSALFDSSSLNII